MKTRELNTVDLFCGAGGATTGLEMALDRLGFRHRGIAINHWRIAVDTMRANHPDVDTKLMSIEEAVPADLSPSEGYDMAKVAAFEDDLNRFLQERVPQLFPERKP